MSCCNEVRRFFSREGIACGLPLQILSVAADAPVVKPRNDHGQRDMPLAKGLHFVARCRGPG